MESILDSLDLDGVLHLGHKSVSLANILSSGPVSLDKGVDRSDTSSGSRMIGGLWSIGGGTAIGHGGVTSYSVVCWGKVLSIVKEEHTA